MGERERQEDVVVLDVYPKVDEVVARPQDAPIEETLDDLFLYETYTYS